MNEDLKKRYNAQIEAIKPFTRNGDCNHLIESEKALLKALMLELGVGTLFITYNALFDEIQALSGDFNCSYELVCLCEECMSKKVK